MLESNNNAGSTCTILIESGTINLYITYLQYKIDRNSIRWIGKLMKNDENYSYATCLTARPHPSDVKRSLVSAGWIPRKPSVLTPHSYQTCHLQAFYGYLFFKMTSSLDAFSSYSLPRGCSAVPCQTTDQLEATDPCSSRTKGSFSSGTYTSIKKQQNCLATF